MAKELPYYSSQKQAATVLSIPIELVRQACTEDAGITRSAGRIDKKKLAAWLKDYEWKKKAPPADDETPGDELSTIEIKRRRELVELKRSELKLDQERDSMLPLAEFQAALSVTISNFRATLNAVPGRAPGKIVQRARAAILSMLKQSLAPKAYAKVESAVHAAPIDYADIEEILQGEVELVLRTLNECAFLDPEGTK